MKALSIIFSSVYGIILLAIDIFLIVFLIKELKKK
jgi:hypothetical protein